MMLLWKLQVTDAKWDLTGNNVWLAVSCQELTAAACMIGSPFNALE